MSVMLKKDLKGTPSLLDEDFYYWTEKGHVTVFCTVHIDDVLACASQDFLDDSRMKLEKRFGDVKRQKLPFTHIGIAYS